MRAWMQALAWTVPITKTLPWRKHQLHSPTVVPARQNFADHWDLQCLAALHKWGGRFSRLHISFDCWLAHLRVCLWLCLFGLWQHASVASSPFLCSMIGLFWQRSMISFAYMHFSLHSQWQHVFATQINWASLWHCAQLCPHSFQDSSASSLIWLLSLSD